MEDGPGKRRARAVIDKMIDILGKDPKGYTEEDLRRDMTEAFLAPNPMMEILKK